MNFRSGHRWLKKNLTLGVWIAVSVLLLTILACEEDGADPTSTLASQPTATIVPTPTSTPVPEEPTQIGGSSIDLAAFSPLPDNVQDVLGLIPARFETLVYLDLTEALLDPQIRETVEKESVLSSLGPISGVVLDQVDSIAVAGDEEGILAVSQGFEDVQGLISPLSSLGANVDTETYKGLEISAVGIQSPFFNVSFAVSTIDDSTSVFGISFEAGEAGPDLVRATVDVVSGDVDGALSGPILARLADNIRLGLAVLLSTDCTSLGVVEGCSGVAISATKEGDDGVIHGLFVFPSPEVAQIALPLVEAELSNLGSEDSPVKSVEAVLDGDTVLARVVVDVATALEIASQLAME